ncbi:hypothetical protein HYW18_03990 [Candidatus Uhrbacteria bacterium]|nr:hypothetical protein [Candidatus Uhrbacteria bacterium]
MRQRREQFFLFWRARGAFFSHAKWPTRSPFLLGIVLPLVSAMLLLWRLYPRGESEVFIPLHYNVFTGIDRYGPWWLGLSIPIIGLAATALHGALLPRFEAYGSRVMIGAFLWGLGLVHVGLAVAVVFLLLLNS